jgi:hypothetical protein
VRALPGSWYRLRVSRILDAGLLLASRGAMRLCHLAAATTVALSAAIFAASCIQSPEPPLEVGSREAQVPGTQGPEPIGEVRELFGSKEFSFVVDVPDDGKDPAGGWQKATTHLHFEHLHDGIPVRKWSCPVVVGMPIRSELEGRISPSRAALLSAEVATDAAQALSADYEDPDPLFCAKFRTKMRALFYDRYRGFGARVTQQ